MFLLFAGSDGNFEILSAFAGAGRQIHTGKQYMGDDEADFRAFHGDERR